jgi:hypothetical protein
MLNAVQTLNNVEDLVSMYNEDFDIQWDENDMIQVPEDDWVSSIIGTDEDAIYDVLSEIN